MLDLMSNISLDRSSIEWIKHFKHSFSWKSMNTVQIVNLKRIIVMEYTSKKNHKAYSTLWIRRDWKTYPQSIGQDWKSDKFVLGNFNKKLVISSLIKQNHVVDLLLLLSLTPLLLYEQQTELKTRKLHNLKFTKKKKKRNQNKRL